MYIQCHSIWNEIGDSVRSGAPSISKEGLDQNLPQSTGWVSQVVRGMGRAQGMRNADTLNMKRYSKRIEFSSRGGVGVAEAKNVSHRSTRTLKMMNTVREVRVSSLGSMTVK